MKYHFALLLLLSATLSACLKNNTEPSELPEHWTDCQTDSDCYITGVCFRHAVNRSFVDDTRNLYRHSDPKNCSVPEGQQAICVNAKCEIQGNNLIDTK